MGHSRQFSAYHPGKCHLLRLNRRRPSAADKPAGFVIYLLMDLKDPESFILTKKSRDPKRRAGNEFLYLKTARQLSIVLKVFYMRNY
jgi:hypothetical protein